MKNLAKQIWIKYVVKAILGIKEIKDTFKIQNSLSLYFSQRASINVVRSRTYLVYAID
jgi:hypothetical protein